LNKSACQHIFQSKKRPLSKQLLFVLPNVKQVNENFHISQEAKLLIDTFWPGDLFLILKYIKPIKAYAHDFRASETALVNVPSGLFGRLCNLYGRPIVATAASISVGAIDHLVDKGPCITVDEVEDFVSHSGLDAAAVIDGGICSEFQHGTIVDCSVFNQAPKLQREGTVHKRALLAALEKMDIKDFV
jgi:L-threonylcarbamoyladenylate synthase